MLNLPHPHRSFLATVAIVCFGSGIVGAHSAHAVDRHIAVSEARAAAKVYEERRQKLEHSLSEASAVRQQAASLTSTEEVADAVATLRSATTQAQSAVRSADSVAAAASGASDEGDVVGPVTAVAPSADATPSESEGAEEADAADPSIDTEGATVANNEVTLDDAPEDEAGAQASPTPDANDSATGSDAAASPDTTDAEPGTNDVAATDASLEGAAELAVDDSDFAHADDARAAADDLTAASDRLVSATRSVEAESRRLAAIAEAALLDKATTDFTAAASDAAAAADDADALVEAVGDNVADDAVLSAYAASRANLRSQTGVTVAAGTSEAAVARLDALHNAVEKHAEALSAVRTAHEEWVEKENARRAEANEAAEVAYDAAVATAWDDYYAANRAAVSARQNGWKGQPSAVSGSNGRVSSGSLCGLDFAAGHRLQCDAAYALELADDAYYAQTGRHLSMTDSYRSYSLQVRTRALKPSTAAVPGTSNHGWGMAVDMDRASALWLTANGADYGWVHPSWARPGGSRPEWWHLEYVATEVGEFQAPSEPDLLDEVASVFDGDDD